ncbi:MAG: segregation/condensation protein A [Candidatus Jorgensenbacteria bacterium]|nr:segregation/condensation protein A [Candidatus Jorgensenbacteria bacterium]
MPFELKLENYQGPMDVLLGLIEEKKMEVTQVSLAGVTADFLAYLEKFKANSDTSNYPQLLADFLVVASKLLLIKSKALLPTLELTPDEEVEIRDFEARVKLYQELKKSQQYIKQGWSAMPQMFMREFLASSEVAFYPPKSITPETLHEALRGIVEQFQKIARPTATIRRDIINLKEKIEEIISRLTEKPIMFSKLHSGKAKGELVALFLAILHLVRQQIIDVSQNEHFGEITVAKRGPAG